MKKAIILAFLIMFSTAAGAQSQANSTKCLADTIYHEGRGVSSTEQKMIGQVVLNRVRSGKFSDSICGVVYQQSKTRSGRFIRQFSWTKNRVSVHEPEAYELALKLATELLANDKNDKVTSALYFSKGSGNCRLKSRICHNFR